MKLVTIVQKFGKHFCFNVVSFIIHEYVYVFIVNVACWTDVVITPIPFVLAGSLRWQLFQPRNLEGEALPLTTGAFVTH